MADKTSADVLDAIMDEFARLRRQADAAAAQVGDDAFFTTIDPEANSIALLMKHVGNNLWSRWSDIFTSDGEKADRHRDREFEREPEDTRTRIEGIWSRGWTTLTDTLSGLSTTDLSRAILIRGEPHSVIRALTRSLSHTAGHVDQIVLLAKHLAGPGWQTLSVPRGGSEALNARMRERQA
jgi:hypothetical protein